MMLEDQILMGLLNKNAQEAMDEIKTTGTVSQKNAIPLMLKSQFNHIAHLDEKIQIMQEDMVTRNEFNIQFGQIERELGSLKWFMMAGFSFMSILIAVMPIIYK